MGIQAGPVGEQLVVHLVLGELRYGGHRLAVGGQHPAAPRHGQEPQAGQLDIQLGVFRQRLAVQLIGHAALLGQIAADDLLAIHGVHHRYRQAALVRPRDSHQHPAVDDADLGPVLGHPRRAVGVTVGAARHRAVGRGGGGGIVHPHQHTVRLVHHPVAVRVKPVLDIVAALAVAVAGRQGVGQCADGVVRRQIFRHLKAGHPGQVHPVIGAPPVCVPVPGHRGGAGDQGLAPGAVQALALIAGAHRVGPVAQIVQPLPGHPAAGGLRGVQRRLCGGLRILPGQHGLVLCGGLAVPALLRWFWPHNVQREQFFGLGVHDQAHLGKLIVIVVCVTKGRVGIPVHRDQPQGVGRIIRPGVIQRDVVHRNVVPLVGQNAVGVHLPQQVDHRPGQGGTGLVVSAPGGTSGINALVIPCEVQVPVGFGFPAFGAVPELAQQKKILQIRLAGGVGLFHRPGPAKQLLVTGAQQRHGQAGQHQHGGGAQGNQAFSPLCGFHGCSSFWGASASVTVTAVPSPSVLASVRVPPWAAAILPQSASPRPLPPWRRARDLSTM